MKQSIRTSILVLVLFFFSSASAMTFNANDLCELVGLPFTYLQDQSFYIQGSNSKGDVVGWASLKDKNLFDQQELIVWYWDSNNGFQVIAKKSDLLNAYHEEIRKPLFQFYKFVINDKGEVAGSFMVQQSIGTDGKIYNQWPWLWWSAKEGLHLSNLPSTQETLKGITTNGFVLLEESHSSNSILKIYNIHDEDYFNIFYVNQEDYTKELKEKLTQLLKVKFVNSLKWYPLVVSYFDNDLKIMGEGTCVVTFKPLDEPSGLRQRHLKIGYQIENGEIEFYIKDMGK